MRSAVKEANVMKWCLGLGILLTVAGCGSLFSPKGCTKTVTVVDSMKVVGDSVVHVDTLSQFKLCAQ